MTMERKERGPRSNQKLKILYLMKILIDKTDENHDITLKEIENELHSYGISAERKSLYNDINNLVDFGLDIVGCSYDRTYHYQLLNRNFELAELKLLVDAVQSSKFITEKKSKELIQKLEAYASKYQKEKLDRQVNVAGRVKTMNENIYYSVDAIHDAINSNCQITFQYFTWNVDGKMEIKHNGALYSVSPWALCWDDEKYYLIGYDNTEEKIKHFRVDKMLNVKVTDSRRLGRSEFKEIRMSEYKNRLFGMFDGEEQHVTMRCDNSAANIMIDRFGKDVPIIKVDENHFDITVKVSVSKLFLGWVMAIPGVKIISPESTLEAMRNEIRRLQEMYL